MACKYCYLEDNTKDTMINYSPLETLKYAVEKFKKSNVIPFNISLHGGEVTTLSQDDFRNVVAFISQYYNDNKNIIQKGNYKIGSPHIKTNLLDLKKHIQTIKDYNVSISGSLDLPFSLHNEYRVTKGNKTTLETILENIKLLEDIPNKKKVSATIFKEHYDRTDEIIEDIKFLNNNTCLDMNDFNFMIGFEYNSNNLLHAMTEDEQVDFYNRMKSAFEDTDLSLGFHNAWFSEFGPEYCTNCDNCGLKFFLLERNGDIYSCVRGQKQGDYYYGNIYNDTVEQILLNATTKIQDAHKRVGFNDECANCGYLYLCKTGCPFVKNVYNSNKSYTCKLQQEIYKDRGYTYDYNNREMVFDYISKMHSELNEKYMLPKIPNDVPNLESLIKQDENLKYIYDNNTFFLNVDGNEFKLESQILKLSRDFVCVTPESKIFIYVKDTVLDEVCEYPYNNALYIQLLSGDTIIYGDEQREKQQHIANLVVYKGVLEKGISDKEGYFKYDISCFIKEYGRYLSKDRANNLFFTTSSLRDYHYQKQKNNGYYHIQAINLPFQNIEFYYLRLDDDKDD